MKRLSSITAMAALVPALAFITYSSDASAADDPAKAAKAARAASPARKDIDMAEFKVNSLTKKMAKTGWDQNESSLSAIYNDLVELDKRTAAIKKSDPAWDTKPYQSFLETTVAAYEAAVKGLNEQRQQANLALERAARFVSLRDRMSGPIATGFSVMDERAPSELSDIARAVENLQALSEVAQECKSNQYLAAQSSFQNRPESQQPTAVCGMADRRSELLKRLVILAAKAHLDARLAADKEAIAALASDGWLSVDIAERLGNVAAYSNKVHEEFGAATARASVKVAPGYFKAVEQNGPVFTSALAAAAKKDRFPSKMTGSDAALQGKLQAEAVGLGTKLVKFRMASGTWGISKNELGIPTEKWNVGAAVVKATAESHCRVYPHIQFAGTYTGGGTYAAPVVSGGIGAHQRYQVSLCK